MEPVTVDTEGASRMVGLAVSTLEKLRVSGDGPPFVKLGRVVRYRVPDLSDWLAARVVNSTSEKIAA